MLVMGVDPGIRGGWAMLRVLPGGGTIRLEQHGALPVVDPARGRVVDIVALGRMWRGSVWSWPGVTAVVEGVGARPQQGVSSTWAFGRATGAVEGVLAGLGVVLYRRPAPGAWKASYGLKGGAGGKAASIALARRLTGLEGDLSDHEAEAILLAWWGAQREQQEQMVVKETA